MKIEELLEKYFEGETSCEEERQLRHYFTHEEVPAEWQVYRPLFACLDEEVRAHRARQQEAAASQPAEMAAELRSPATEKRLRPPRRLYRWAGIAAGILLLIGVAKLAFSLTAAPDSYVIIDGVRYTDQRLVEAKALEALQSAGFSDEELGELLFQY